MRVVLISLSLYTLARVESRVASQVDIPVSNCPKCELGLLMWLPFPAVYGDSTRERPFYCSNGLCGYSGYIEENGYLMVTRKRVSLVN